MGDVRLQRLRQLLVEHGLEALLITNAYNRRYMTGFTGSAGYVIVTADQAILLTDFRYTEQAASQATQYDVLLHEAKPMASVKSALERFGIRSVGFEQGDLTYSMYLSCRSQLAPIDLVPTDQLVEKLRMVKDDDELRIMREAAQLADAAFQHILTRIKPGVSERQLSAELEYYMRMNGADSSSFDTIVASGVRSALPHGVASDKLLQRGDFITFDFGAYYKGYCSDLTRTVVLGSPSERHQEIYDIVLEAQETALAGIRPGMTGSAADALARDVIKRHGYGDYFGHGTGHGLGMEIHESPRLSLLSETILEPGMVVTVEPGIYIPGFGGVRIEDDVVITPDGKQVLTGSPKQLLMIDPTG